VPRANANFAARYGYTNAVNFDGESLLQPRFAFNWNVSSSLSLRGGIGVYSGGNPNVWVSNNYSNDGFTQVEVRDETLDDVGNPETLFTIPHTGDGQPIFDIPQSLFDAVAAGTADSATNSIDPGFEIPSDLKIAIGLTYDFGRDYTFMADFLYSEQRDAAIIRDLTLEPIGTAPDGRPIYRGINRSDPDCAVDPSDSATCSGRSQDFSLANAFQDGGQEVLSLSLRKSYPFGLDWTVAYAHTDSEDVNPMTSSVAFSNYANIAVADPNNPGIARSNYEIPHRLTVRLDYEKAFFRDYGTQITLYGTANEGRPFTYTFTNGFMFGDSVGFIDRQLLYVPSGPTDPNVTFGPGFNQQAFFDFLGGSGLGGYGGGVVPRNAFHSSWWTKFDLRISQELPGFNPDHNFDVFFIIENLGNLLNDDWGTMREASFPRYQSIVDAGIDSGTNTYVFNEFFAPGGQSRVTDASLWEIRFGLSYNF
jgi:hypothetical protein